MPGNIRVKVKTNFRLDENGLQRQTGIIKREFLYKFADGLLTTGQHMVSRRAPKNADSDYGYPVVTRWKTGAKAGQVRRYYKKGRYSAPGSPPFMRATNKKKSLANMAFHVDTIRQHVIFGPLRTNASQYRNKTVPNVHEFGGTIRRRVSKPDDRTGASDAKELQRRNTVPKRKNKLSGAQSGRELIQRKVSFKQGLETAKYPERPYMYPTLVETVSWFRRKVRRRF